MEETDKPLTRVPTDSATAEHRLRGHIGHLIASEEAAFTEFKELLAKDGLFVKGSVISKSSHDDATLMYAQSLLW